ncbi:MAG: dTMP kinase [bacterium]|nr:dTMP kinase [bacterium]
MPVDADQLAEKLAGKFIVFDGPDGCGKGTQLDLLERRLTDGGCRVVRGKDPGGTVIGDRIRQVVLGYDLSEMDVHCETLLFMASRAQLIGEVVRPAVAEGKTVLCDRFVSATCAYQGAQGYDARRVLELAPYAIGDCWPDVTVVLDLDAETGFARTGRKPHHVGKNRKRHAGQQQMFDGVQTDAMEARPIEFHRRVRENFVKLPEIYPRPVVVVDARVEPEAVHTEVLEALARVAL